MLRADFFVRTWFPNLCARAPFLHMCSILSRNLVPGRLLDQFKIDLHGFGSIVACTKQLFDVFVRVGNVCWRCLPCLASGLLGFCPLYLMNLFWGSRKPNGQVGNQDP